MRITKLPAVAIFVAVGLAAVYAQTPTAHPKRSHRKATPKPFVLPPVSKAPLPQVPMDMLPSAAPHVTFQAGMLTIVAQNSTLGDILREVHKQTGASIDVPANATERVATRLGPAPPREVLADLLNGSAFNYVMLGKSSDPDTLVSVSLTSKPAGAPPAETVAYQPPPQYTQPQQMGVPLGGGPGGQVAQGKQSDDEEADAEEEEPEENAEADQDQAGANAANENPGANAGPRNPQEILEQLRKQLPNVGQPGAQGGINPGQQPPQQPPQDQQ